MMDFRNGVIGLGLILNWELVLNWAFIVPHMHSPALCI